MGEKTWRQLVRSHQPSSQFALSSLDVTTPFEPDVASLNLLARPPLAHVGLDGVDVYFEEWDGAVKLHGMPGQRKVRPPGQPAIWFDSLFDNLCVFAVEEQSIQSLAHALAALAPACVDAFFAFHALPDAAWPKTNADHREALHALGLGPLLPTAA